MNEGIVVGWSEFAVASAGAAGALAGLLIVAISVNIREIIAEAVLPVRAGATVASVVAIMIGSLLILLPAQPAWALGLELLVVTVSCGAFQLRAARALVRHGEHGPRGSLPAKIVLTVGQMVPLLLGALLVCVGQPAGMYWVAGGFLLMFVVAIVNAWVLMVEILR